MASSDLSTDLSLGVLTPTPSVRPADGQSAHQEAEGEARRRAQPGPEDPDDASADVADPVTHQLDHLA